MEFYGIELPTVCHVVALPYPGRGHINPMMNLCKLLSSKKTPIFSLPLLSLRSGSATSAPIPNPTTSALPPSLTLSPQKVWDLLTSLASTKLWWPRWKLPLWNFLISLSTQLMLGDVELPWTISVGNRRNIPVASVSTMPTVFFSMLHHWDLFVRNRHLAVDFLGKCY